MPKDVDLSRQKLMSLLHRLCHYALVYVPGPKWSGKEAADRTAQAHRDAIAVERLAAKLDESPLLELIE